VAKLNATLQYTDSHQPPDRSGKSLFTVKQSPDGAVIFWGCLA
jgi:hypothetical protein